jgi:hypothetical protein
MKAPLWSVTTPVIDPVTVCPIAMDMPTNIVSTHPKTSLRKFVFMGPRFFVECDAVWSRHEVNEINSMQR